MKTRIRMLAPLAALALVLGGCASSSKGGGSSGTDLSGCPKTVSITATDSAKTLCVAVGGTVTINLTEATGPWLPLAVSGSVLVPSSTSAPQVRGPQTGTYTAKSTGTAQIMSSHPACPQSPGMISCHAIVVWKVTVNVK
jgi:hypothetical protein